MKEMASMILNRDLFCDDYYNDSLTDVINPGFLTKTMFLMYRVFFFLWIQSGGCRSAILRSFMLFLYFLHSKIWAHFHFGTFDP